MNTTILTEEERNLENIRMQLEEESLVSLKMFPKTISRQTLLDYWKQEKRLTLPLSKEILDNRNLKEIDEEITLESAITIKRTEMKYYPTEEAFYINNIVEENIATILPYATPILLFHTSLDQKWVYVQASFYRGWIHKEDILLISEKERERFEKEEKFVVITHPLVPFLNTFLDLGTRLPLIGIHDRYCEVLTPTKEGIILQNLSREFLSIGYLPYTRVNIIEVVKNCLGIPYRWGAIEEGVDCSFLIQSLFHVFGLFFPRDTNAQEKVIGLQKINLQGLTEEEKKEILNTISYPAILHKKGHILLAISKNQVIHAYGDAGKVILSSLNPCYGTNLYPLLTSISLLLKS